MRKRLSIFYFFFLFLVFSFISLFSGASYALIKFEDAVYPEFVTSGRPLAMGNAYICKVDDSSSVFYNPAGLGTVRWSHFHLTNLHLELNKDLMDAGAGGNISDVADNSSKAFSLEGSRQLLLENRGLYTYGRFNVSPNLTTRYFSLGFLYSRQMRTTIDETEDAKFEFADRQDMGPYAALNISLFGGVIKFGGAGVVLRRKEIIDERDREVTVEVEDSEYKKGTALIFLGGARLTLPFTFLPTFAANIHNATQKEFSDGGGAGPPETIKKTVDVGFSITPQLSNRIRVHLEVNYKDASNEFSEVVSSRKILLGLEFDFMRAMFVRMGYGDGYGTAGIGLRSRRLEFDLSTYAVDTSEESFRGSEDRRFAMTISSGI